jgi:hypothetical protein
MKFSFTGAVLLFLATLPAQGRIGEALEEMAARFGEAQKDGAVTRMAGHEQYYFEKDSLGIECVIGDGKCVMEVFHRIGSKIISDEDIKNILKVEADGHGWGFNYATKRWMRSDGRLQAYRQPGHDDYFFLEVTPSKKKENGLSGF